jgi:hypothetical protein
MAPVLCITTTGDMHHEDALQDNAGDRYVSALLLSATIAMSLMYALDSALLGF